jgi:hypothetical protein
MPATFAHPAAILPLRRWCPAPFNFAALVIGTMAPDLGYFAGQWQLATYAHSFGGSLVVCVPSALLVFCALHLLRKPLVFLAPQPHRAALTPLANRQLHHSWRAWMGIAVSTLLGAWTHCAWDSFTHANGWMVQRIGVLRATWFTIGDTELATFYILQQASTVIGTFTLVCAYVAWLRRNRARADHTSSNIEDAAPLRDRSRYAYIAAAAMVSLTVALTAASTVAAQFDGFLAVRVFLFRTVIYFIAGFVPLVAIIALVLQRRAGDRQNRGAAQ